MLHLRSSCCGSAETNLTCIHEDADLILGPVQWVKDLTLPWAVEYVGRRCGSDLVLLWLWFRPATRDLIQLPAWEPPSATPAILKKKKKKKKGYIWKRAEQLQNLLVFKPHSREPWRILKVLQEFPSLGKAPAGQGMEDGEWGGWAMFFPSTLSPSPNQSRSTFVGFTS